MEIGTVMVVNIEEEMKGAYLDYAMSVIVSRALPDVRDGLKPVQRRILYSMYDMGLLPDKPYKKSARIVGETLGKYHPHGDAAVYDAMARMAQDFSLRYPLVDGQGNFGSIDGDNPAAMRYTEARLAPIALEMLADIEKNTVDFVDNFDGSLKEPAVLPARLPNLLVNGAAGIAVGMATNIPPHNLREVCDAIAYLIDNYRKLDKITVEDLMRFIKGPDFPTGGIILGYEGLKTAYATGKGRIVVRSLTRIEEAKGGRYNIIVTQIPYQINKSALIERIAELVRSGRIDEISDLRDESDREGMSIVIELKRGADPRTALNKLFKYSPLQLTYGINMLALVDGEPRLLSLKRLLWLYVEHRREVLTRRTRYELEKARHRAHIVEGLLIALANLDEVIRIIRRSRTADTAMKNLMRRFKLTQVQAQAILDMPLRRLAALERRKLEEEHKELKKTIRRLEQLLKYPRKILGLIKEEVLQLKAKYGDARRTQVLTEEAEALTEEDLVVQEQVLITLTKGGLIYRQSPRAYKLAKPEQRGSRGVSIPKDDAVSVSLAAQSLDTILFFTDLGKVYSVRAYQIENAGRQGTPLKSLFSLSNDEHITAALALPKEMANGELGMAKYLVIFTRKGRVKRLALSELSSIRSSGLTAIKLDKGDAPCAARLIQGDEELVVVTRYGQALRFPAEDVRPMGREAAGVWAIKLGKGDEVAAADVVNPEGFLVIATEKGYAKRVAMSLFPTQHRYGQGVIAIAKKFDKMGPVAAAVVVGLHDEVIFFSARGVALRLKAESITQKSRAAMGDGVMELGKDDKIATVTHL
ncbi:MAG: DNA gyrase subunit A [Chloroflexi bacterium]|nr:MAG: DNA gyrase subunit A [Chloroflexota bacterium]